MIATVRRHQVLLQTVNFELRRLAFVGRLVVITIQLAASDAHVDIIRNDDSDGDEDHRLVGDYSISILHKHARRAVDARTFPNEWRPVTDIAQSASPCVASGNSAQCTDNLVPIRVASSFTASGLLILNEPRLADR